MKSAIVRLGQSEKIIFDCNCNYNNDLLDKTLQLGLICNISCQKQPRNY